MAERVAAALDHLETGLPQHHAVPAAYVAVERGDARDFGRPDDLCAGRGLDLGVPAGVVGMPVGVENQRQLPAQPAELAQDCARVRRVDAGREAAGLVADQEAVVVLKAGKLVDGERHP